MAVGAVPCRPAATVPDVEWLNALVLVPDDRLDVNTVVVATGARIDSVLARVRHHAAVLVERTRGPVLRARRRYVLAVGQDRGYDPRVSPRVEHRVGRPAGEVACVVVRSVPVDAVLGTAYDADTRQLRVPVALHIPFSWPSLPMWLAVTEHSAGCGTVSLELRSRRRLRYPYRYFSAAHAVLDEIARGCSPRTEADACRGRAALTAA
jgi:hypothetical protein